MIDTSRSSIPTAGDVCAFCGGRQGLTRQHAVPYWFMHEVHADPRMIHSYLLTDISGLLKGSFDFPNVIEKGHGNQTEFWTCEECIGGWISDLELEVIEPFSRLVRMPVSTKAEISSAVDFLASVSDILSRGAIKTVLACDFAVDETQVIPLEHYRDCAKRRIPAGVSVDLGFCETPTGFRIISGPLGNSEEYSTRCIYRVAFQTGHLAMMVRYVDGRQYDPYPGTITLFPDFRVGEELEIFSDSLAIIGWDIIALAYHNERTNRKFYGILD